MVDSFKWAGDAGFHIDDATASVADISTYTNNASIATAINILETTAFQATAPGVQNGLANTTLSVSYMLNSTTEAIFGPLHARTSLTKTAWFYNGIRYYTGEFLPSNVQQSGDSNSLLLGSCDLTIDGAVSRTSTAPA